MTTSPSLSLSSRYQVSKKHARKTNRFHTLSLRVSEVFETYLGDFANEITNVVPRGDLQVRLDGRADEFLSQSVHVFTTLQLNYLVTATIQLLSVGPPASIVAEKTPDSGKMVLLTEIKHSPPGRNEANEIGRSCRLRSRRLRPQRAIV